MEFDFFVDRKKTLKALAIFVFGLLMVVYFLLFVISKNYYNNHSDDVLQYFTITENYILRIKAFDFSLFNLDNYFGASVFSDAYYVPIDGFTLLTLLLSFIMNFDYAFALVELMKIFAGTMMFAYLLHLKGSSNKALFYGALIYMISGMNVSLMAFPAYLSTIFYLPLAFVVVIKFFDKKRYFLPLLIFQLILYNFYIAYTSIIFTGIFFLIEFLIRNHGAKKDFKKKWYLEIFPSKTFWKKFGLEFFSFFALLMTGVLMGALILYPSAAFILDHTYRVSGKYNFFSFPVEQYIRIIEKLFTPQFPSGFYALRNSYVTEHLSMFMTITGLIICLNVFDLKDRTSNIYKIVLLLEIPLLFFPFFYMIFSGNSAPYTRWIAGLVLINIVIFSHVVTQKDFEINLKSPTNLLRGTMIFLIGLSGFIYIYDRIILHPKGEIWARDAIRVNLIFYGIFLLGFVALFVLPKKIKALSYSIIFEFSLALAVMFSAAFGVKNKISYDQKRDAVNRYLNNYFPLEDDFYRISLDKEISLGESININRTNRQYTNFQFFHSFYDKETNAFTDYIYNDPENQTKSLADSPSPYLYYIFGQRYQILKSDTEKYLPESLFSRLDETDDFKRVAYAIKDYTPFLIYDKIITTEQFLKYPGAAEINYETIRKQMLMSKYVVSDEVLNLIDYKYTAPTFSSINFLVKDVTGKNESGELTMIEGKKYIIYDLSRFENSFSGKDFIYYYYSSGNAVSFSDVFLEYSNGKRSSCFERYCYLEEKPTKLYVEHNDNIEKYYGPIYTSLKIQADSFEHLEQMRLEQNTYQDKKITYSKGKINVSFTYDGSREVVVFIPITYSKDFICSKDYRVINVNGGFLGIVIPQGETNIDFSLKYTQPYFTKGLWLSSCGFLIFGAYVSIDYYLKKKGRLREDEKSKGNSSLL